MSALQSLLAGAALFALVCASTAVAANARTCSDPCLQAARAELRDCASGTSGTFRDATDGCLARDLECVDACQSVRQDCRDATGAPAELLRCEVERVRAKAECRDRFVLGSTRRVICIDRAQVSAFHRRAGRRVRRAFACGPGAPPGGVRACRAEGKAGFLALGYRVAAFERDFGTGNDIDLQFRGPTSSMGFVF